MRAKFRGVEAGEVLVHALHLEAQGGGEVLLVAEHHVHEGGELAVHLLRPLLAADGLPERRAVVEVVGHEGSVLLAPPAWPPWPRAGSSPRGRRRSRPCASQRAPCRPKISSQSISPGLSWRHRGVAAVGAAHGRAHAEAALGEVEAVAGGAPDPVVLHPAEVRLVDPALVDEVLHEAAHRVVHEGGDDGGVQAEAALEARGPRCTRPRPPRPRRSGWCGCGPRRGRGAASLRPGSRGRSGSPPWASR